jgi:hypothetical protein
MMALLAFVRVASDGGVAHADEPAALYDLGSEFSVARNPNGPWEYGFSTAPSLVPEQFVLSRDAQASGTIVFWHPAGGYYPYLASNPGRRTVADPTRSWALRPHEVALEASISGQPAIVRFVAPRPGRYRVKARFAGIHFRLSSTDVHVLVNGVPVFDALVEGYGGDRAFHAIEGRSPRAVFVGTRQLAASDVVSFAVGYGANQTHFNDTTGLRARIAHLPSR